ncbi:hypothetical protein [Maribacter polysaccharolyticus]|uniref:hypothetical protein n=1 Tax=Maribacter polysaccharolyticus TaxID=3020831 RepID=UPI00237FA73E|nr:hypothetical protein [Maribacter polysaccharolyticus]MDE3744137.1 hypothetical protein [Maribacter polysaccharolyticus]
MERLLNKYLITILIIVFAGCKNKKQQEKNINLTEKVVSNIEDNMVALEFSEFDDYPNLLKRVAELVCNDSVPVVKIRINDTTYIHKVSTPCWDKIGDILIKQKNVLIVHDDSIEKRFTNPWMRKKFGLSKLGSVLEKDLSNNGKDQNWSESPAKHILSISVSDDSVNKLQPIFLELSRDYEQNFLNSDMRIWLTYYTPYFVPPPPPKEPEKVEEIKLTE